ncbi:glutaredoxin domain-containing protein [Rhodococcus rhodochrous]|uniref:glutaredoxin domain-containing protein n=1 Tax=Rhodococcus rhodochrous TaxID=1829 RepID=UPI00215AEADD|nr:hypothetical protein [Rhodococcus pyridinivorans]
MWRTWILSAAMVAVAAVVLLTGAFDLTSVVTAVLLLVLAWVTSPLFFPHHVDDATVRRDAAARGVPVVYWRPGCTFCIRLRAILRTRARRAIWVNIWRDPAAAARVREVNGGNETVPTVFVGDVSHTNPDPRWLRDQLV